MRYEEIEGFLSTQELNALETLEGCGWEILTETKIEDTFKKDGGRIRTFTLSGRYDLAVVCKDVKQLIPVEEAENLPSDEPPTELPDKSDETDPPADSPEPPESLENEKPKDNFWMDESNWKMTSRNAFKELVTDNVDDLKSAPDSVQGEVYKKWTRFFDKEDWPL